MRVFRWPMFSAEVDEDSIGCLQPWWDEMMTEMLRPPNEVTGRFVIRR